ncbi:hypothetical protein BOX15_Mlig006833g4 [Macrostomum lignano]|uniref:WD_REPEATS_REGION domain-containing protein n=1 Tax=Macrostomum lignano TaxID=282301 RepID=A0A267FCX0_9PLAT|nr:hypothetical protein BOX15_Mlig006833g1 [Macrostomum lignano]PAA78560.1 hypothetical protein BOX15_Mlig006833g4 [Macrostomum lignano]
MSQRKFYPTHCWVPQGCFDLVPRHADKDENYAQLLNDEAAKARRDLQAARAAAAGQSGGEVMDADAGGDAENEAPDDDDEDIDDIQPADADAADDGTDDEDDEDEDSKLVPTDNLVVVAQVQQNQGISEAQIHVYNEPNKQFYEHRCFYLDSMPLCFEFVGRGGHLLAIGRMEQSIQLWDLDLIEALLPSVQLEGHKDAVLDVSWNPRSPQALASASADKSVGLWDLDAKRCVRMLDKLHSDKVQCLAWHPQEPHLLLTGGYDSTVRLSDCRAPQQQQQQSASSASSAPAAGSAPSWRLDGECERLVWDSRNPFFLMASTERGSVQRCDARAPGAPVSTLTAHDGACSGLCLTDSGLLCTGGADGLVRLWRSNPDGEWKSLANRNWNIGEVTKLTVNPDCQCVLGITGLTGFQVWDVREHAKAREYLRTRGVPV